MLIAAAFTIGAETSAVPVAAPLVAAPAQIGYAHAVPQNIPPYASQISVTTKNLSPLIAAPAIAPVAAPFAPAPYLAGSAAYVGGPAPYIGGPAPYVAGPAPYAAGPAPYVAGPAPYVAGPAPYVAGPAPYYAGPAPYAAGPAPYAAPYPYGAPLIRSPLSLAPAYVR